MVADISHGIALGVCRVGCKGTSHVLVVCFVFM